MTTEPTVIEVWEGHDVTSSALDINIGHGLREALRILPMKINVGEIFDIAARIQCKRVAYEPSHTDKKTKQVDYEGPYTRIQVGVALIVAPATDQPGAKNLHKFLDNWSDTVAKHRELTGQGSLLDEDDDAEALADQEARLAKQEADDFYDSAADA
jgi:hypothetical protein